MNGPLVTSAPFYLHQPVPAAAASTDYTSPSMACSASGCLIAYAQTIGGRKHAIATRVSAAGAILGRLTVLAFDDINGALGRVQVATRGSEFIVYTLHTRSTNTSLPIHTFHVVDAAGAVRIRSTSVFGTGTPPAEVRIYGGGANALVTYKAQLGTTKKLLLDGQLTPIGAGAELGLVGHPNCAIAGPGHYLVANNSTLFRISDTTGDVLDSPKTFWRYGNASSGPVGFLAGGVYYLLGTRPSDTFSYDIWGVRVQADTGALLDPDDDFNQRSGGVMLCQDCYPGVQTADLVAGAGYATVNHATAGVSAFRFTLSPFARIGSIAGADLSFGTHRPTMLVPMGSNLLAFDGGLLKVFTTTASPFGMGFGSQGIAIPRTPDVSEVSAAFSGGRFLVAAKGMVPTLLLDERGTLAPVAGLDPGGQVVTNGTDFMLTQQQAGQAITRPIATNGTVGTSHTLSIAGGSYVSNFRLTSNNRNYLLTAQGSQNVAGSATVSAIRIASDGTFLDQGRGVVLTTSYAVLADTTPDPAMRTFGIFGWDRGAGSGGSVQWYRLRSETGMIVTPTSYLAAAYNPFYATDGEFFVSAYNGSGAAQTLFAILTPGPGGTGYGPTTLDGVPGNAGVRGAWFDGRSYLLGHMYTDVPAADPTARFTVSRYSYAMQPLDLDHPEGREIIPDKFHAYMDVAPTMASDGWGTSLVAYLYADPFYGGVTLKGLILRNEGYRAGLTTTATCASGDTFDLGTGTRLTEGGGTGTDPWTCDPRIGAERRDDENVTLLMVHRNYLADFGGPGVSSSHRETLIVELAGPSPSTFPATYSLASGGTATMSFFTYDQRASCQATAGTVTLTALGSPGTRLQGSTAGVTWSGTHCPTWTNGTFSITRDQ